MKYALVAALVAAVMTASPAFAADGQISQAQLSAMGLGNMQVLTDAQGATVRGEGFPQGTGAFSFSGAAVPGAFNTSGGVSLGNNFSFAASGSGAAGAYFFFPFFGATAAGASGFGIAIR